MLSRRSFMKWTAALAAGLPFMPVTGWTAVNVPVPIRPDIKDTDPPFNVKMNLDEDTFKVILMDEHYDYDRSKHGHLGDIKESILPLGNGHYPKTMQLREVTEDENPKLKVEWDDVRWFASGGSIGPTKGAVIYNDSLPGQPLIGYVKFGDEPVTQADGGAMSVSNVILNVL
jgi:hypothetical protein